MDKKLYVIRKDGNKVEFAANEVAECVRCYREDGEQILLGDDDLTGIVDALDSYRHSDVGWNDQAALAIGQSYQGGKIAYIDATGQHGLIAATSDQGEVGWAATANQSTSVQGTLTTIGSGAADTAAIIAQNGAGIDYAAGLARAYTGGGYTDWYLPSKDELNQLYLNQTAVGGFDTKNWYWSSSEHNTRCAWYQYFANGFQYLYNKGFTYYVRAVRTF